MDLEFYTLKRTETQILKSLDHKMESRLNIPGKEVDACGYIQWPSQNCPISVKKDVSYLTLNDP
jgi:hypothetical protein